MNKALRNMGIWRTFQAEEGQWWKFHMAPPYRDLQCVQHQGADQKVSDIQALLCFPAWTSRNVTDNSQKDTKVADDCQDKSYECIDLSPG